MDGTRTKRDENNATIFIPIRVSSYPCSRHPCLFSQEKKMLPLVATKRRTVLVGLLTLLMAGLIVGLRPQRVNAAAPSVTFIGADITTHDAWRTTSVAKPLDVDGDNIYGTDGFYLFGGHTPPPTRTAPPAYATVTQRPGTLLFAGNASYIYYDNPDLTGSGPVANVISGVVYSQPGANIPTEWVDITFTRSGYYRIGIITDNADFVGISPLNFRFQQITGGTVDTGYVAASTDRDRDIDHYLFDIEATAGDVYRVSGQSDPLHASNGIGGIFFDGFPYQTITDTTAGTATNNGTVAGGEYVGYSTGINNGFGNVIGSNSQLHIDADSSGNLNLGLKAGAAVVSPNAMVVYLDTDNGGTGFSTTSGFTDTADGCRRAISGFDGTNRSTLNFATGFTANYAICLDNGFAGLWQLTNGGSHTFITSLNRTNTGTDYEMNFTLANLGLSAGSQIRYVATYLNSTNGFRSNEFHGVETFAGGNPGYTTVNLPFNSFILFKSLDLTLVVDRADDTNAAAAQVCDDLLPNDCSLRGAISKSNAAASLTYTISFDPSLDGTPLTLTVAGDSENANATGDLDITRAVTINGNGTSKTIVQAGTTNLNGIDRVFHVGTNVNVTFNDLTIRYGRYFGASGGGILNDAGTVTVNRSLISSNTAAYGGGIMNDQGTLTINQTTITDNGVLNDGGGIRSNASNLPATLNVYNSTISGNRGFYRGGGILVYTAGPSATAHSTATLINTTVTNNRSNVSGVSYGGMLMVWDNDGGAAIARITLQNSLIADPSVTVNCVTHLGGQIVSNNNNLDSGNTCALAQPNDIANGTANLGVLQDNGGPTFTQALLSGSQAIDAGNNAACAAASINNVDQRGVSRPQNSTCDIGAYEYVPPVSPGVNGGNGPGGVGVTNGTSPLLLWLRADTGIFSNTPCTTPASHNTDVACWRDQSGYNRSYTQAPIGNRPTYFTGIRNGQPVIRFNGSSDRLTNTGAGGAVLTAGDDTFSYFATWMSNVANYQVIYEQNNNTLVNGRRAALLAIPANQYGFNGEANDFHAAAPYTTGQFELSSIVLNGNPSNNVYVSGRGTQYSGTINTATQDVGTAGGTSVGYKITASSEFFNGDIPEIIVYGDALADVDRILVENYMSAKYAINLNTNDVYDGDSNGDFDLDVAGIGRFGGVNHTQSHAGGMIVVNNSFLKENGDWLLFGHRTASNDNTSDELPTSGDWDGVGDVRWARHWYIDVTDASANNGTVNIIFDFSDAGMSGGFSPATPANNYRLLKRSGINDQFSDITAASGAVVVVTGDQVQFLGVDVAQLGSNFTLGSLDGAISPTAITTQNADTQDDQTSYLTLAALLLIMVAATVVAIRRRLM
ncbi:MAG: choice-of-anchor Q domain-containing protein [Candidatus Promineifilaceae bacterium]